MSKAPIVAALELGGTKCIAAVVQEQRVFESVRVPTGDDPVATLNALNAAMVRWHDEYRFAAIGIASFGPIDLDPRRASYGHILSTPKPGWANVDIVGAVRSRFDLPIALDTDVAGAALAEGRWGAARGCLTHAYLTIGTGVGLGLVAEGRPVHGRLHPEAGHVPVRRIPGDPFAGNCPFHGDCLEGLVSGPAIAARTGLVGEALGEEHPVWSSVASEIGQFMASLILTVAPERIVLGGGVIQDRPALIRRICAATADQLAGYVLDSDAASLRQVIVPPGLEALSGILGGAALALGLLSPAD